MKKKIFKIKKYKNKKKIVCLTAYSKPLTKILDKYCDIVLVGDSVATAFYGMKNTKNIDLKTMLNHAVSVKKSINKSLLVFDMPYNTYSSINDAKNFNLIKKIVKSGVPVMGHIGFTPQFKKKFKVQGVKINEEKKLLDEAKKIQEAGAFSIVLECISKKLAYKITKSLKIPTIGIGSSNLCDGQILVTDDLLGLSGFYPKFIKKYANLEMIIDKAIKRFKRDVIRKKFPTKANSY